MTTLARFKLLLPIAVALTAVKSVSAQELQLPVWQTNDTWNFTTTTLGPNWNGSPRTTSTSRFTVLDSNEEAYLVKVDTTARSDQGSKAWRERITKDLNRFWRGSGAELAYLRWPLVVGKTWTFENPIDDAVHLASVRVVGWEDVTVGAGRFHTIVIQAEASQKGGGFYFQQIALWYAPEAKWVVKVHWKTNLKGAYVWEEVDSELQSFSLN